jgi:YgiT-type zinc finger domain-containing protein
VVVEKSIQHVHQWSEKIVIFEDVPAEVCQRCGEVYFSPEVLERMDAVTIEGAREEVRL